MSWHSWRILSTVQGISGSRIRQARLKAGLTQAALARAVNTSERNIVRWENNHNAPRMEYVAAIAEATSHDLAFFLGSGDSDDEEDREVVADLMRALDRWHDSKARATA